MVEEKEIFSSNSKIQSMNYIEEIVVNDTKSYLFTKRLFDIFGSLLGLIILSPLFLVVFILLKIEDFRAPFFFSQKRVGKDGKEFKMFKIRSMCVNAEDKLEELLEFNEVEGAMFKMKEDPRITKVGKFIRKYSIDELPQLWNVFIGDMTLVGPRPPLVRELIDYTEYDKQRLKVTPGCTGLWQTSGRNDLDFSEMVKLDLEYISKQSVTFDLKIIFKTVKVILAPDGAY